MPIVVDYSSNTSIKTAFGNVDVAICALGNAGLNLQGKLAKSAKEAGVKLFVPSEWGSATEDTTNEFFAPKIKLRNRLMELGLPYAVFFTGSWTDWSFARYLGGPYIYIFLLRASPGIMANS